MKQQTIYIGWDPRESDAWEVARHTLLASLSRPIPVKQLRLGELQQSGLYKRPTETDANGRLLDKLSARSGYNGQMSTEHANARFFTPMLAKSGWSLFMDGDVLVRGDLSPVFDDLDERVALYCVKHEHRPVDRIKMDGCVQTRYERKNWSSFMIFNCDHPKNKLIMDPDAIVNNMPGRDLHAFCWLDDEYIGGLDLKWNYLVGHNDPRQCPDPVVVHFTSGVPDMPGYKNCEYAEEWFAQRNYFLGEKVTEAAE